MSYTFKQEQDFRLPIEEVFAFFATPENLEKITPPFLNFSILSKRPIEMRAGSIIDYRLRLYGVPFYWRTEIESFEPEQFRFTDIQTKGPYRTWHHTHEFFSTKEGTRMVDTVRYSIPFSMLGRVAHWAFVKNSLRKIFSYRKEACERLLGVRNG